MGNEFIFFDSHVLNYFYTLRSPLLNSVMIGITNLGGGIIVVFGFLVVVFLLKKKLYKLAFQFVFSVAGSEIVNFLLKNIFHRIRPQFHPLIIENDFSFPSGHAMNSFVFYLSLSYIFFQVTKNRKLSIMVTIISTLLIIIIGISRIYLGVHYPSDVLGGYIAGIIWFVSLLLIQSFL